MFPSPLLPCAIAFTQKEIQQPMQDAESWNEAADFWDRRRDDEHILRDGRVPVQDIDMAEEFFDNTKKMSEKREKKRGGV
jgi:hypothetical protein